MEFWLFAPFRLPLNLNSERVAANPVAFGALMQRIAASLPETVRPFLSIPGHDAGGDSGPRFQTMDQHGSGLRSLELFQLLPVADDDVVQQGLADAARQADERLPEELRGRVKPVPGGWRIIACDNSVALLWVRVQVESPDAALLPAFDQWSNHMVDSALGTLMQSVLYPVLDGLRSEPEDRGVSIVRPLEDFQAAFDLHDALDMSTGRFHAGYSPLMWVGRVCMATEDVPEWRPALSEWAPALDWSEAMEDTHGATIHLAWGNSVVFTGAGEAQPVGLVDAFLRAQYYYAAMDVLNRNLMQLYAFLGESGDRPGQRQLQRLNARVGRSVVAVDTLAMEYRDTRQEVQGKERRYLERLLRAWGLDDLLHGVHRKLELVRERLERLNRMRSLVGQRRVELLLIFVGSVAVLELGMHLARLAGPLTDGWLLGWITRVSPDWLVGGAVTLVVIICLIASGWLRGR